VQEAEARSRRDYDDPFGEGAQLELAAELLEVSSDAELDEVLRDLIARAGRAVGKFIDTPRGNAIGGILKGAAKRVISAITPDGRVTTDAARSFGLEIEGLSNEDREFEVARHYVDFAGEAVKNLALDATLSNPGDAASAAVVEAAKSQAPGLLSGEGKQTFVDESGRRIGRWGRRGDKIVLHGIPGP
jgi:hypothetical protein